MFLVDKNNNIYNRRLNFSLEDEEIDMVVILRRKNQPVDDENIK